MPPDVHPSRSNRVRRDDVRALLALLARYNGRANGRLAVDVVEDVLDEFERPELRGVIDSLADLNAAEEHLEEARERLAAAEVRLAEAVGVRRRDKDTGFDARFEAERMIVNHVLAEEPLR